MNKQDFDNNVEHLLKEAYDTLITKNGRYAKKEDQLHHFKRGAETSGKNPAQTCWGYAHKHLTSLLDMMDEIGYVDESDLLEKCQDLINYIIFEYCLIKEHNKELQEKEEELKKEVQRYINEHGTNNSN